MKQKNKYVVVKKRLAFDEEVTDVWVIIKMYYGFFWYPTKGFYYNERWAREACSNMNKQ